MSGDGETVFKRCSLWTAHDPHEVRYFEEDFDDDRPEDYSCPGIITLSEQLEALERRAGLADEMEMRYVNMSKLHDMALKQADYHSEAHRKAALALQMATTSPDTKAAHEIGYRNGLERGLQMGRDSSPDLRTLLNSLQAPLLQLADAERLADVAADALENGLAALNDRIMEATSEPANPEPADAEPHHVFLCSGYHDDDGKCQTGPAPQPTTRPPERRAR